MHHVSHGNRVWSPERCHARLRVLIVSPGFIVNDKSLYLVIKIEHAFCFMTTDNSSKTAEYMALFRAL